MNDRFQPQIPSYASGGYAVERNRVLRNTYTLLAISLVPTVAGAWAGLATGLGQWMLLNPGMGMILFLAGAFGLMFAVQRNRESGLGVAFLPRLELRARSFSGIACVPLNEPATDWDLGLVWRRGGYLSHAAQAWLALARELRPNAAA